MRIPLLNFEGAAGVPLLNFGAGSGVPLLIFRGVRIPLLNFERGRRSQGLEVPGPGVLVPLLHHAVF